MKNEKFAIEIDKTTGFIASITLCGDKSEMNFVSERGGFGEVINKSRTYSEPFAPVSVSVNEIESRAVYENGRCRVSTEYRFLENGNLQMRYGIKNITHTVICVNRDTFCVNFPFNDRYTYAEECMNSRCHTHIWCGENTSWINALKMGVSDYNIGMLLTEGSLVSYSQYGCKTNERGYFQLEPETVLLKSGEEYTLSWEMFPHSGNAEFFEKLRTYNSYIGIKAKHYTVFMGESLEFTVSSACSEQVQVYIGDSEIIPEECAPGFCRVKYTPAKKGEYRFDVKVGKIRTHTEMNVKTKFAELTAQRVHFIVKKQQCLDRESPLYGAYLVYDNKLKKQYFDYFNTDHNACRERLNMAFTIIKYLQKHPSDKEVRASLDLFVQFLFREFYEESTGEVFNNIGKNQDFLRLYNAPGVMLLFSELYRLTGEKRYLRNIVTLADKYYSIGGERCYSNAVAIKKVTEAFELAGMKEERERVIGYFRRHVENMISNSLCYPKHEVNYEQTIVTPAVLCLSEYGAVSGERERCIFEARKHLECLDLFSGHQPSHHLNEIAIRFWDDYWFGKSACFGDTFPHHLSCLSARAFVAYGLLSGARVWIERAEECVRNCLSLIGDDGRGSAAYVYPHTVNGAAGEFYDEWANDQDLPLYDGMCLSEYFEGFEY